MILDTGADDKSSVGRILYAYISVLEHTFVCGAWACPSVGRNHLLRAINRKERLCEGDNATTRPPTKDARAAMPINPRDWCATFGRAPLAAVQAHTRRGSRPVKALDDYQFSIKQNE